MVKTIDGISVNYIDEGEGEIVLLLHGWGANITLYQIGRASCRERV